ncbi:MAG: HPr family phosphocarrier protein [Clostridiales bacterium]|nr:HPr family phosphocarrier protein [Clostridiales bacterium]
MKKVTVTIESQSGLHARPASTLVAKAQQFESEIFIEKAGAEINAKSIIGILGLGVSYLDEITVTCTGDDEDIAIEAMKTLIEEVLKHQ